MLTPAELVWLLAAVAKGDEAAFERLYAATRANSLVWCSVSCADRISRRKSSRRPMSRSGTAPDSSIPAWHRQSPGWLRSPGTGPSTSFASGAKFRLKRSLQRWKWLPTPPIRWRAREMTEELKRLLECVGRLEPDRQKLVLLAYYNGWSREQLAAKFETPVNTVKTWLRRSMMDIRECLGLG